MENLDNNLDINKTSYIKRLFILYTLFFKLGILNFGGGYAMLPLLTREIALKRGWANENELRDYYAVGQCTPGAIAVNVSTFIGYKIAGILGGVIATLGFITPAFVIIFVIASFLTNFSDNPYVINALKGINVVVFVLILSAIKSLVKSSIVDKTTLLITIVVALCSIFISSNIIPLYVYVIISLLFGILINVIRENKTNVKAKNSEIKEEVKPKEKKKIVINKNNVISYIIGFLVGAIFGLLSLFSLIFIKNKKYKNGIFSTIFIETIMLICTLVLILTGNNVFFKLYFNFFRIGLCAFGGGLATFPFLKELGEVTGWFSNADLTSMLAISESTPGAMGVNMSTYVGYTVSIGEYNNYPLSFLGSIISTLGLVTPSIIVIIVISLFLDKFKTNKYVEYAFYGLRASSVGLIIAACFSVLEVSIFNDCCIDVESTIYGIFNNVRFFSVIEELKLETNLNFFQMIYKYFDYLINWKCLAFGGIMAILVFKFKKHPVFYIILGIIFGILLNMASAL